MKKALKWIGILLGGLLALLVVVVIGMVIYGQMKFKPRLSDRQLYAITADTSPEGQARGKYLMEGLMNCTEACHSEFSDRVLAGGSEAFSEGPISVVFSVPNLTPDGETGLGSWSDAEIARAIREGVDKDGVGLMVMPAFNYHVMSDEDTAAVLGYLRSLEPVQNEVLPFQANAVGKIMNAFEMFGPSSIGEPITSAQSAPQPGTVENGAYLVSLAACRDCHKQNLAGGAIPFSDPEAPQPANLTPAGDLTNWSQTDFMAAVRTGALSSGSQLTEGMPRYQMTDEDLADIFKYLKTLPPVETEE